MTHEGPPSEAQGGPGDGREDGAEGGSSRADSEALRTLAAELARALDAGDLNRAREVTETLERRISWRAELDGT